MFGVLAMALVFICCNNTVSKKHTKNPSGHTKLIATASLVYNTNALLGEGAFWDTQNKMLYWIDIEGKKLHLFNPSNSTNRTIQLPQRIGTVVPQNDTTVVMGLEDGIYKLNINTQALTLLSPVEKEATYNRFNDGKCDPNGNLWIGSMHLEQSAPRGKVYKIAPSGKTTMMIDTVTISNGIVWSKDSKTMYYIDTPTGEVRAYDFNPKTSTISNPRVVITVAPKYGYPDGMAIDSNDHLWIGMWNGNAVAKYDPKTGTLLGKIAVPAHNVTSCAFGGQNLDQLFITTASVDMTPKEQEKYPLAGSLFIANPGVKGVKSIRFGNE